MKSDLVLRVAAKAVIANNKGQLLIMREAATYLDGTNRGRYHIPGGRLEKGEAFVDGLRREVREETGLEIELHMPLFVGEWRPVIRNVPHQIIAIFMACQAKTDVVKLSDEHDHYQWINPKDYKKYDMMPPDDEVIEAWIAQQVLLNP